MRWFESITDSKNMNLSKLWEIMRDRGAWCATLHGATVRQDLATEQQQKWDELEKQSQGFQQGQIVGLDHQEVVRDRGRVDLVGGVGIWLLCFEKRMAVSGRGRGARTC